MTLRSRDLDLEKSRHVTLFVLKFLLILLDILDIPDDFGKQFFLLFVPHTLFVSLDILDILDEYGGGANFFP